MSLLSEHASSSSTLAIPGQQSFALSAPATGIAKLEPRLLSILEGAGVPNNILEIPGNKNITSTALFANLTDDAAALDIW